MIINITRTVRNKNEILNDANIIQMNIGINTNKSNCNEMNGIMNADQSTNNSDNIENNTEK